MEQNSSLFKQNPNDPDNINPGLGIRHLQTFLMFLCLAMAYGMRGTMSVALVAMTTPYSNNTDTETFSWSKKTQGLMLSSFYCGYMAGQIPAGQLAHKKGATKLLFFAMIGNGVCFAAIPLAASLGGWVAVCVCRIIQGFSQACVVPCTHTLLGHWAPIQERSRLGGFVYGGAQFGTITQMPLAGVIAAGSWGWPGIFYVFGGASFAAGLAWIILGADTPADHKTITDCEKYYITLSLGHEDADHKTCKIPWRKILKNKALWALALAHVGQAWGQMTLFVEIPSYMNKVVKVDIKKNGLFSALPFLVMWICSLLFSFLADYVINKNILSITTTRKVMNTIGSWPTAIGLIILAHAPPSPIVIEGLLFFICGVKSATLSGVQVNHIDLMPNFAGTAMSLTNCLANGIGALEPILTGLLLWDESNPEHWMRIFYIAAVAYFISNLYYIIFGSGEKVYWNDPDYMKIQKNNVSAAKDEMLHKDLAKKCDTEESPAIVNGVRTVEQHDGDACQDVSHSTELPAQICR